MAEPRAGPHEGHREARADGRRECLRGSAEGAVALRLPGAGTLLAALRAPASTGALLGASGLQGPRDINVTASQSGEAGLRGVSRTE